MDRVGRNVRDTLNTQTLLTGQGRVVVTADHVGVWDFSDPNQENEWLAKAWGSQMELRAIQKRNRDEAIRARKAGEPKQRPSYGYRYVRQIYDPGTGHAAQIAELVATRTRLREDRQAGLYDSAEDAEWYRTEYRRLVEEITVLKALPERKPGMRMVPTGRTIAQEWDAADNVRRREMLAEFEPRVVLHPTGHDPRVAITGMEISRTPLRGTPSDGDTQPAGGALSCTPAGLPVRVIDVHGRQVLDLLLGDVEADTVVDPSHPPRSYGLWPGVVWKAMRTPAEDFLLSRRGRYRGSAGCTRAERDRGFAR